MQHVTNTPKNNAIAPNNVVRKKKQKSHKTICNDTIR